MHLHPAIASSWSRWVQRMLAYRMRVLGLHFVAWPSEMSCIRSVAAAGVAFLTPQHSFAHTRMSCSWKGHGLPLHPASHMGMGMCVCVCVWVAVGVRLPLCVCALYSFSSALAHFRSADTETDTMAGSEFWCISGEAAPRLMVERAREEFMFNLRKIMIIFYFMVERTTTSSYFFSSFPMHPGHIFRMHK